MFTARRHKLPAFFLILALFVSALGGPAAAAACVHPARAVEVVAEHCAAMGDASPCCCGPAQGSDQDRGARLEAERCGCALEAPAPAPPAAHTKAIHLVQQPDVALPASRGPAVSRPSVQPWTYARLDAGPPTPAALPNGPSRAPPARL